MVISHNLIAMNAQHQFNIVSNAKKNSTKKLSSGYRINQAADDAAGLSISEKMRNKIRGLDQGSENIQDGISLLQVADGALEEVQALLRRMTALSIKAANDTNTPEERHAIQQEIQEISNEITRIGRNTSFNDLLLFDDMYGKDVAGSVTNLVSSPAAETGYLTEAIKVGPYWFPSASIDFSNINETNIQKLDEQGFSFCCSRACKEVFNFTFKLDGTPSSASNLVGKVKHDYDIDISQCKSGKDIVDTIYSYVSGHLPSGNGNDAKPVNKLPGCLPVSHSNYMIKSDDGNKMIIYANTRITSSGLFAADGYTSEEAAKKAFPSTVPRIPAWSGSIDCSQLLSIVEDEKINEMNIQCSNNVDDCKTIYTHRMNAMILGVSSLNVSTAQGATKALDKIKNASKKISEQRSELGAFQNQLEHSYQINQLTEGNTQSSESLIRDTDISKEMLEYSKQNILEQVGMAMMAQANQNKQGVLLLL